MDISNEILNIQSNPKAFEDLYRSAEKDGREGEFRAAVAAAHAAEPDNLLLAAWFYRLENEPVEKARRAVNWLAAIPLSVLTGLVLWALSDVEKLVVLDGIPQILLWWAPVATFGALLFLAVSAKENTGRAVALGLGLLAAAAYALILVPTGPAAWQDEQYLILAVIHIPLLCWVGLGIYILGFGSAVEDRFALLIKSVEVAITAGLYLFAGMVFGGITLGLLAALGIEPPELLIRLIVAGGIGLLPVLAVASVYDPEKRPAEQEFERGLSQVIATMMRLIMPLTLLVLTAYIIVIPFNFVAPFKNRDVLIVYNLMQFAVIALLIGATPIRADTLPARIQDWLRRGIIGVAVLAELVSLYAFAAVVYRTSVGGLTLNRLAVIGWNGINIGILAWLIYGQLRGGRERWVESAQSVFSKATNAYVIWGLVLVLLLPLLF